MMDIYEQLLRELISPVTVIVGEAELLKTKYPRDTSLMGIGEATDRVFKIVTVLRDFHGLNIGALKPLDVLVVDDKADIGKIFVDVINSYGDRAVFAHGGREGIDKFLERSQQVREGFQGLKPYSLVLTDLLMPDVDGYGVVSAVKNDSPQTRVVVVSGTPGEWERIVSERGTLKPDSLLPKPSPFIDIYFQLAQTRQGIY